MSSDHSETGEGPARIRGLLMDVSLYLEAPSSGGDAFRQGWSTLCTHGSGPGSILAPVSNLLESPVEAPAVMRSRAELFVGVETPYAAEREAAEESKHLAICLKTYLKTRESKH